MQHFCSLIFIQFLVLLILDTHTHTHIHPSTNTYMYPPLLSPLGTSHGHAVIKNLCPPSVISPQQSHTHTLIIHGLTHTYTHTHTQSLQSHRLLSSGMISSTWICKKHEAKLSLEGSRVQPKWIGIRRRQSKSYSC